MTLPRWWDNRLKFGLALALLVVNGGIHLILLSHPTLAPGWSWGVLLYSIAFFLFHLINIQLIRERNRRSLPPPPTPRLTWRGSVARFRQMPLRRQVLHVLYDALIFYVLLLLVLILANLFAHWSDGTLYSLLAWSAMLSIQSLGWALTAAEGLGWWDGWETAGSVR